MSSRSLKAQQGNRPAVWPPQVWPPVTWPDVPPIDAGVDDDVPGHDPGPLGQAADLLVSALLHDDAVDLPGNPYALDPHGWVTDVLGEFMWSKQVQIAEAVRDHRRVAVPSAHETGKSWLAARIVAWWLSVWPPGDAFAVTTAPSAPQVRAILWREINRAHKKGNLPGRTNQTEWWIGDQMVGFGRKPADYSPTSFQGIHAKRVLVVIDEGCGVPSEIYRAAQSLIANEYGRLLVIGNPDDPQSHFADICLPGSGWVVIPVSAFDTPNFTGEDVPRDVRDVLVNRIYTDELAADVGEDSPIYIAKALGRFPEHAANGVVPLSFVRDCQRLDRPYEPHELVPVELGVDVGAGGDETVIRERRGRVAGRTWRRSTPDWSQAVAVVLDALDTTGATRVKIDVIGIGWGVVGRLRELHRAGRITADVVAVDVRMASYAPQKYARLRDQLWWEIGRELSRSHAWDLSGVDDGTVNQLISPTWAPDSSGRVQVERKADTRKRLKRSPDDADALLLAYYTPPKRAAGKPIAGGQRRPIAAPTPLGSRRVVARLNVPKRRAVGMQGPHGGMGG